MNERKLNKDGLALIAIGALEIIISIPVAWLFGLSTVDVLFVRDISLVWVAALGYGLILAGIWMAIKPIIFPGEAGHL